MQPYDANQPNEARFFGGGAAGKGKQGAAQPPAILNNAPTPACLLRCLQRRLVLALSLGVVLAAIGGTVAWFVAPTPKHQVRMLIRLPTPGPEVVRTSEQVPDQGSHQRTQIAYVKSQLVLEKALKDENVKKQTSVLERMDPTEWLEKELQVDFTIAPEIMKISLRGMETDELKVIIKAIYAAYQREILDQQSYARKDRKKFLAEMIGTYEGKLARMRVHQKDNEDQLANSNVVVRAGQIAWQQQMLRGTQGDILSARSAKTKAEAELANLKAGLSTTKPPEVRETDLEFAVNRNLEVSGLKSEIAYLEQKKTAIFNRSTLGTKAPSYIEADKSLEKLKKELAATTKRVRGEAEKTLQEFAKADRQTAMRLLQQEIARSEATIQLLQKEGKDISAEIAQISKEGAKMDLVKEETGHYEKMLQTLRHEQEALNVELGVPMDTKYRVLEQPTVVRAEATARKSMIAGGVAVALILLSLLGVAYLEYRTRKVTSVDEVVLGLGMRLVGTVPNAKKGKAAYGSNGKKVPTVSQQVLTESIDAARTTLLHLARSHSLRTVMVTSAIAGEGKTSLTCHLAASLARAGLRVLLIDADMRNPSAHKLFGMKCDAGFSEVLCDKAELKDCVKDTPLKNLAMLAAGHWSDQTAAALNQGKAAALFQELRQQYDIIVVDSSPVLPVADSLLLGQQVDAVVLSVMCEVSRLNNLYAAWQRVQEHGGQPLGVVINGAWGSAYGATYHYPYPRRVKVKA